MDIKEKINGTTPTKRHPWELARLEVIVDFLKTSITDEEANISIIDIGCGDLFVLDQLSYFFKFDERIGVDIAYSNDELLLLKNKYSIKLYNQLEKVKVKKGNATIILLNDVIEHIEDDQAFIREVSNSNFVNSETIFIITVPAFQSLFSAHDVFLEHYRRYHLSQLKTLLINSHFSIQSSGYFFFSLLFPRWLSVKIEKNKSQQKQTEGTGLSHWEGGRFITLLIKKILLLDYWMTKQFLRIGITLPGLSTFVICKKSV